MSAGTEIRQAMDEDSRLMRENGTVERAARRLCAAWYAEEDNRYVPGHDHAPRPVSDFVYERNFTYQDRNLFRRVAAAVLRDDPVREGEPKAAGAGRR